jgi:23S rRNA G2445 N2-methylase RlmL
LEQLRPSRLPGGVEAWATALASWSCWRRAQGTAQDSPSLVPKFRVSVKRGGKHGCSSNDMAQALAGAIEAELGWIPDLTGYDLEVSCHYRFSTLLLGIRLNTTPLGETGGLIGTEREKVYTVLKASLAYSLLAAAGVPHCLPGSIVLDPMCGSGTVPEAAATAFPTCFSLGGDYSEEATDKAARNAAKLRCTTRCSGGIGPGVGMAYPDIVRWDASRLPIRDSCIDFVVTDMPFGKKCGSSADNTRLYPRAMQDFHRVLRMDHRGGKAVLLTTAKSLVVHEKGLSNMWKSHKMHYINMGGQVLTN